MPSPSPQSRHLIFRTWSENDFELARSLWGDADVMAFLGGALAEHQVREKLQAEMTCLEKHGVQYWAIFERESNEFVGCCGTRPWNYPPFDGYEIGFHLMKSKWGKGYAFEGARAVVGYAFGELGVSILRTGHHPENIASRKVLLKLGFQPDGAVFYKPTGLMHPTYQLRTTASSSTSGGC
jgi:RimJ/RimL family protein N-acetyltransferase